MCLRVHVVRFEYIFVCLQVQFRTGPVEIVACTEDKRCSAHSHAPHEICSSCELPVCNCCMSSLAVPSMPELSLTNELWTGFVLGYIYEHKCTYLDVICASPLAPAMVSYQLDLFRDSDAVKQHNPHVLGQTVHAHSGPMGAHGSITAFMMPREDV